MNIPIVPTVVGFCIILIAYGVFIYLLLKDK